MLAAKLPGEDPSNAPETCEKKTMSVVVSLNPRELAI
jgi:hypothetical protein